MLGDSPLAFHEEAGKAVIAAWKELVAQDIQAEDEDAKFENTR